MIVQTRLNGLNLTKSAIHTHREIGPKSNLSRLKGQQREITVDLFSLSLNGARHYFIAEEIHGDLSAGLGPILCVASLSLSPPSAPPIRTAWCSIRFSFWGGAGSTLHSRIYIISYFILSLVQQFFWVLTWEWCIRQTNGIPFSHVH